MAQPAVFDADCFDTSDKLKMKTITPADVLLYYDYPQIFSGLDGVGARYLCMLVEESIKGLLYYCVPLSVQRYQALLAGRIEVRTVYEEPELADYYTVRLQGEERSFPLLEASFRPEWLPDFGLELDCVGEDEVWQAALQQNAPVSFVSLEVAEAKESARIHTDTLSAFLMVYQNVLQYLCRAVERERTKKTDSSQSSIHFGTDVFGFAFGSFTIKLRSSAATDLLGETPHLRIAFERMNALLALSNDPEALIHALQQMKGHAAGSVIKLLEFCAEHHCPLVHRWASPSSYGSALVRLEVSDAAHSARLCRLKKELNREEVFLSGSLEKAAVGSGDWMLHNEADGKTYSGKLDPDAQLSLDGVVMGSLARYAVKGYEVTETVAGTGREVRNLYATQLKKL